MKIFVIGDGTTVTGFRLAGVTHGFITEDHEEAKKKLLEIVNDRDIGLIILTEKLAEKLREEIKSISEERMSPLIVEIPDKFGPIEKKVDPLKELVKRAVGVEIKVG